MKSSTSKMTRVDSRRQFVKMGLVGALTLAAAPVLARSSHAAQSNLLIACFSHTGNTLKVVGFIQECTNGELVRILPVRDYPQAYDQCVELAKEELQARAFPEITTVVNPADYTTLFLGYPNWWGTLPRPVCTFLKTFDFAGKTIAPFCTHGGGGLADSVDEIRALCPRAKILKGLAVRGRNAASSKEAVQDWLQSLVF